MKFHLQHVMTRRLCVVPEMVVLVILVDWLIVASILPSVILVVLAAGVGWLRFFLACFRFRLCLWFAFSCGSSCFNLFTSGFILLLSYFQTGEAVQLVCFLLATVAFSLSCSFCSTEVCQHCILSSI